MVIQFIADASEVMDMLLKTHSEGDLPDDDPQTSYLISAWTRICKILGRKFKILSFQIKYIKIQLNNNN